MLKSLADEEENIPEKFWCRHSEQPLICFKGVGLLENDRTMTISQTAYLTKLQIIESTSKSKVRASSKTFRRKEHHIEIVDMKNCMDNNIYFTFISVYPSPDLQCYSEDPGTALPTILSTHPLCLQTQKKKNSPSPIIYHFLHELQESEFTTTLPSTSNKALANWTCILPCRPTLYRKYQAMI